MKWSTVVERRQGEDRMQRDAVQEAKMFGAQKPTNTADSKISSDSFGLSGNQKAYSDVLDGMESNWMAEGRCNDQPPGLFFPSDGVGVEVAKKICAECPSKEPCLEYALANRIDHGVWGGTSERQRRRILKARRSAALAR